MRGSVATVHFQFRQYADRLRLPKSPRPLHPGKGCRGAARQARRALPDLASALRPREFQVGSTFQTLPQLHLEMIPHATRYAGSIADAMRAGEGREDLLQRAS